MHYKESNVLFVFFQKFIRLIFVKHKPTKEHLVQARLEAREEAIVQDVVAATGLSPSEIVRRSLRLTHRQKAMFNSYSFLLECS